MNKTTESKQSNKRLLITGILLVVLVALTWHFLFPLGMTAAAIGAGIWSTIVMSIILLCVAILLAFLVTGISLLILSGIGFILAIVSVILMPFTFPIMVPLLVVLLVINLMRKRQRN